MRNGNLDSKNMEKWKVEKWKLGDLMPQLLLVMLEAPSPPQLLPHMRKQSSSS